MVVSEDEEGDEAHEGLQHARVRADEGALDALKEHRHLLTVATELGELLANRERPGWCAVQDCCVTQRPGCCAVQNCCGSRRIRGCVNLEL